MLKHKLWRLGQCPMNLDGFPWPTIGQRKTIPAWDGGQFIVDLEPFEILTYSETESAWMIETSVLSPRASFIPVLPLTLTGGQTE